MTAGKLGARSAALADLMADHLPVQVVDVGANPIGAPVSYQPLLDAGLATVTAFEPQDDARAALDAAPDSSRTTVPHAIGDGTEGILHICRNDGFTSLFAPDPGAAALFGNARSTDVVGTRAIKTARLDEVLAGLRADFLKIDIQGGELAAIAHGRQTLSDAMLIQTEIRFFPLYEDEPSLSDLWAELVAQGFQCHSLTEIKRTTPASRFKRPMRKRFYSQLLDGDAFFVRDLRRVTDRSDRQLAVLALMADTVMDAPDLALFCLDTLAGRGAISADGPGAYVRELPEGMIRS